MEGGGILCLNLTLDVSLFYLYINYIEQIFRQI